MITLQDIQARRSVRRFTSDPISVQQITTLLDAAQSAPSAMTLDPWSFVVAHAPEAIATLTANLPYGRPMKYAGAGIIVCGDQQGSFEKAEYAMMIDCSLAVENICLAASGMGLGTCILIITPKEREAIRMAFGIPEAITPILAIAVGNPKEIPEARSRYNTDKVHFNQW